MDFIFLIVMVIAAAAIAIAVVFIGCFIIEAVLTAKDPKSNDLTNGFVGVIAKTETVSEDHLLPIISGNITLLLPHNDCEYCIHLEDGTVLEGTEEMMALKPGTKIRYTLRRSFGTSTRYSKEIYLWEICQ